MECADIMIAAGRCSTSPSLLPARKLRKAMNVIRTYLTLARPGNLSADVPSHVAINIPHDGDTDSNSKDNGTEFSVGAEDESFKGLVKEKRHDCFLRLGGSAGIAAALVSNGVSGIRGDDGDVLRRKKAFGANTCTKPKRKGFFSHVWDALSDLLLVVLIVSAFVTLGFDIKELGLKDGWAEGVGIFLAVLVVSAVSAVSKLSHSKRFDKLASESISVTVIRSSRRQEITIFDIVVGEVVILKIGDSVPADGVFLEGHGLQVDESSMTGEPHPIDIDAEKSPFLTAGVKIIDGYGRMLVTAVGTDTLWGEMVSTITKETTEPTPLQERLEALNSSAGKITVAMGVLVTTVLAARHFTDCTKDDNGMPLLVTTIVVTMPNGLPLAVTLTLAFSIKRMVKEKALVRRLLACETMGSITVICTAKTGTLTLNQMEVTEFWVGTEQPRAATAIAGSVVSLLCRGAGINTTGSVYKPDDVSPAEISGSPTEKALLSWAVTDLGMDADALKRSCKVMRVEAFNSDKMRSGVLIQDNDTSSVTAHWKGAAEIVLANCSMYVDTDGGARELGVEQRKNLEKVISDMAVGSLRCIAFAYKQVGSEQTKIDDEGLTLLGFVGLKAPCRAEIKADIEAYMKAGVAVKMVTGDNILTARAVALECGILSSNNPNDIVIEGHEFRTMSPEQQLEIVDKIHVMARSLPVDKLVLVKRLKQKGHVVAMTGDGTNDAPALMEADVGLSMGVECTAIAKESSDIIILKDNFATVVTATRWGRCVYNNIQKFIQFQLTVNVTVLVINFLSAITTGKMLVTTVQLLWVNLIMNTIGALALAADRPTKALMDRPPIGRTAPLITNAMWRNIAAQAVFQIAVVLVLQHQGRHVFGTDEKANGTMIFNVFFLCQVFNEFNAREIEKKNVFAGLLKNRMFLVIIAVTVILQVVMMEVRTWFAGTIRLGLGQWGICLAIAAMSWPIGWAVKFIPVPDLTVRQIFTRQKSS